MRLCWPVERYRVLTTRRVTGTVLVVWLVASTAVGLQSSLELGPNLCNINWKKPFTMTTNTSGIVSASIIVGAPMIFTVLVYARIVLRVRSAMRGSYKPPVAFNWDYELTKANMYSFFLFGIFWLPLGVAFCISVVKPVSPKIVVYLAWFALSKSCFNNLLYCVADRHFRSAYVKLFHYCCCKTTVSFSRRQRGDGGRSSGDVRLRVHIIHSYASPASCRPAVTRPNGRDIYEL
ncbi:PREDICTED: adenosine receptor A3-like [Ceratosolen solmsi marchali]|uniref:Adenosine receptor A3-like n=1 Tax=Ceratosolen solmsi marchali TaxID=326594 RepID=A0AAJ6VL88_9HYME|nr:PREDICTED: adenosine receptor A3-like [Ceratosolen solmsi marchali]